MHTCTIYKNIGLKVKSKETQKVDVVSFALPNSLFTSIIIEHFLAFKARWLTEFDPLHNCGGLVYLEMD